jgi:hypothetical protein
MVVSARPLVGSRSRTGVVWVPLAMWAVWRLAHLVVATFVGGHHPWIWYDDAFYEVIMRHGYGAPDPERQYLSTNFFPLLSWTARGVQVVVRSEWLAIHLTLSAAQVATVLLLHRIALRFGGRRLAVTAVALLLLLPTSVFLWMFFTEGLFLALSMGTLLLAEQGRSRRAALLGIAVAASRTLGILVVVPLLIAQWQRGERRLRVLALSALPVVGLLVVMTAQWIQIGDPLSFSKSSKDGWDRETTFPLTTVFQRLEHALSNALTLTTIVDIASIAIAVVAAIAMTQTARGRSTTSPVLPWSLVAWTWLMIVAPLTSGLAFSWGRYMLAAWPVLLVVAHRLAKRAVIVQFGVAMSLGVLSVLEIIAWHEGQFIG